jgi:hypothetical protein
MLDKNYIARAEMPYTKGRHYWEITLVEYDVVGEVGVHEHKWYMSTNASECLHQVVMGEETFDAENCAR